METLKSVKAMTVIVALMAVALIAAFRAYRGDPAWKATRKMTVDFLNGMIIVPFIILVTCVFSDSLLRELMEDDKLIVSMAGAIGLFFVIGEFVNTERPT